MWTDTSRSINDDPQDHQLPVNSSLGEEIRVSTQPKDIQNKEKNTLNVLDDIQEICHRHLDPSLSHQQSKSISASSHSGAITAKVDDKPHKSKHVVKTPKKINRSQSAHVLMPNSRSTSFRSMGDAETSKVFPTLSRQEIKRLHDNFNKEKPKAEKANEKQNSQRATTTLFAVLAELNLYYRGDRKLDPTVASIHQAIKELPWITRVIFENIESSAKSDDFIERKSAIIDLLMQVLEGMEGQNIFKDANLGTILKRIGLIDEELYTVVQIYMKEIIAKELIQTYLKSPDKKAPWVSHCWFVETEFFIKILAQEAVKNPKEAPVLLEVIHGLISQSRFYHIPMSSRNDLARMFKELPQQPPYKEMRHKLLDTMRTIIHDLQAANTQQEYLLGAYYKEEHKHAFIEAAQIIESGHESRIEHVIDHLAMDLKKIEALYLSSIPATEFVSFKRGRADEALHIDAYIQYTNALTTYIIARILGTSDAHMRARWYEFFIKLMKKSVKIGNYNTAFTLFTSLQNTSVTRLKITLGFMGDRYWKDMEKLEQFFSQSGNYKNYREHLEQRSKELNPPPGEHPSTIPFFALFLKNFTFIDDGNPTHSDTGYLNQNKITLLADQHLLFQKYQNDCLSSSENLLDHRYHYNIPNELHNECKKIQRNSKGITGALNELAALSDELEPRPSPHDIETEY